MITRKRRHTFLCKYRGNALSLFLLSPYSNDYTLKRIVGKVAGRQDQVWSWLLAILVTTWLFWNSICCIEASLNLNVAKDLSHYSQVGEKLVSSSDQTHFAILVDGYPERNEWQFNFYQYCGV